MFHLCVLRCVSPRSFVFFFCVRSGRRRRARRDVQWRRILDLRLSRRARPRRPWRWHPKPSTRRPLDARIDATLPARLPVRLSARRVRHRRTSEGESRTPGIKTGSAPAASGNHDDAHNSNTRCIGLRPSWGVVSRPQSRCKVCRNGRSMPSRRRTRSVLALERQI